MAETTEQKMQRLIEAYRRGDPVADELRTMPKDELKQLKTLLEKEKKKTSAEITKTRQTIRAEKAKLLVLQTDQKRLTKELETLNVQLWSAFGEIYNNPEGAFKKAWAYEQKHGLAATDETLKTKPQTFGSLRGVDLLIWQSVARRQALHWVDVFSYRRMRTKYGEVHQAKTLLENTLQQTQAEEQPA